MDQKKALAETTQVTFLPMENIGEKGELDCSLTRDIKDVQEGYTQFFDGDVLIAKITPCFENGKGAIVRGTLSGVGFGTTELHVLAPKDEIDARFLYYITTGDHFRKLGEAAMFGAAGQKRVPEDFVRDYRVPLPPLSQQRAIADRLDRETGRLDALVAAKRRLLELLAEKRRALIAHAVTRGLDPEARDSGGFAEEGENDAAAAGDGGVATVEEWPQQRLKHLVTINDEVLEEDTDHDTEIQYIDIGNVDSLGHIHEPVTYRFEDAPSRARRRVRDGDVIISTVRTYLQAITQIHDPPDNLIVSTGFAVVRPLRDRLDSRYCKFALREASFLAEIEKRSVGVSYPAINASDLANIPVNVPPLPQQRAIADHLDRETGRLDALAGRTRESVALLRERRAALISAAVGGR